MLDFSSFTVASDSRLPDLPIHYAYLESANPKSAIVLMPSARGGSPTDRARPYFLRWTWANCWPDSLVISIADPVLSAYPELDGGWFIHSDHDVLPAIAGIVSELISQRGIPQEKTLFYGSSLGGFGAIGAAAHLPGAKSVAEVPQTDVQNWMPHAVASIERSVLGRSMSDFRLEFPERIELSSRILSAGYLPPIHLISNKGDRSYSDQSKFIEELRSFNLPSSGDQFMELIDSLSGHKVLSQAELVKRIKV